MDISTVGQIAQSLGVVGLLAVAVVVIWRRQNDLEKRLNECMEKRIEELAQDDA